MTEFLGLLLLYLATQIPVPSKMGVEKQGQAGPQMQLLGSILHHLLLVSFGSNLDEYLCGVGLLGFLLHCKLN